MGIGFLQIEATTADSSLPVVNAHITVIDESGKLLYEGNTDIGGSAGPYSIEAPNKSLTMESDEPAYSLVDVIISAPNFVTEHINGVQIQDTRTAILPIIMEPLAEGENPETDNYVTIPPLGVVSPETDPDGQPGPADIPVNSAQGRILPDVLVPDYITVHLGAPNVTATNVRVKFTDYIANVLSREIYSTWPRASLIANCHAAVSFTLNRVFSEWYPSQGKPFDITNNTNYDHAFTYNGTIYDSIRLVVNEYFNTYIRRIGFKNPFFAMYCAGSSGSTARCPHGGMPQWGTQVLANRGYTPIEILRYFYGNDIELVTTNNIEGITSSYPGTPLSQAAGSTGSNVRRIQDMLNRIRVNFSTIPQITNPNGVFNAETTAAVRAFQTRNGLTVDGIVGQATWNKITQVYNGVIRLAELDSEGIRIGIGTTPPTSTISQGSRGNDVLQLQFLLNFISEYYPEVPMVIQDSLFGADTRTSVIAFQKKFGLTPDGSVGPQTWAKLYAVYHGIKNEITVPPLQNYFNYTVVAGDTLFKLAQKYNTTVEAIMTLNGLTSTNLSIGQVLKIPTSQPVTPPPQYFDYTVIPGDTLFNIAGKFDTTVDAIKALNGLTSNTIHVGQVLKIPNSAAPEPPCFNYTVVAGDTLWTLSQRFGTTIAAIMAQNGLTSSNLSIGQVLCIPTSGTTPPNYITHTVVSGDTLWLLAQKYGTTVQAIMSLNGLTSSNLSIGQVLRIPIV